MKVHPPHTGTIAKTPVFRYGFRRDNLLPGNTAATNSVVQKTPKNNPRMISKKHTRWPAETLHQLASLGQSLLNDEIITDYRAKANFFFLSRTCPAVWSVFQGILAAKQDDTSWQQPASSAGLPADQRHFQLLRLYK